MPSRDGEPACSPGSGEPTSQAKKGKASQATSKLTTHPARRAGPSAGGEGPSGEQNRILGEQLRNIGRLAPRTGIRQQFIQTRSTSTKANPQSGAASGPAAGRRPIGRVTSGRGLSRAAIGATGIFPIENDPTKQQWRSHSAVFNDPRAQLNGASANTRGHGARRIDDAGGISVGNGSIRSGSRAESPSASKARNDPGPARASSARASPARASPARTDTTITDPARASPARTDTTITDPARASPARTDTTITDPARASPARTGTTITDPARASSADNHVAAESNLKVGPSSTAEGPIAAPEHNSAAEATTAAVTKLTLSPSQAPNQSFRPPRRSRKQIEPARKSPAENHAAAGSSLKVEPSSITESSITTLEYNHTTEANAAAAPPSQAQNQCFRSPHRSRKPKDPETSSPS